MIAAYLRHRQFGYYFEFKLLAFVGPLALLIAVIGAGRLRRLGAVALAALIRGGRRAVPSPRSGTTAPSSRRTRSRWPGGRNCSRRVRRSGSTCGRRTELWAAYFLASRPECSQQPLYYTDYPHVAYSRKADYIVATKGTFGRIPWTTYPSGRPKDAIGPPIAENLGYLLYKENPAVPGIDYCTYRRYDRIYTGAGRLQVFRRP